MLRLSCALLVTIARIIDIPNIYRRYRNICAKHNSSTIPSRTPKLKVTYRHTLHAFFSFLLSLSSSSNPPIHSKRNFHHPPTQSAHQARTHTQTSLSRLYLRRLETLVFQIMIIRGGQTKGREGNRQKQEASTSHKDFVEHLFVCFDPTR